MSKKYYITESQMKRIVSHVKNSDEQEVIEEGWKEVALGAAMLLGATFGGNKAMAQQANDAINQTEILQDIKNTLEDSTGIEKLAKFIKWEPEKLEAYMVANGDQIENDFNYAAKKNNVNLTLDVKDIRQQRGAISGKLQQGYAVTDIIIHSDTIIPPKSIVTLQDTIDVVYSSDAMFVTGKYQLKPEVMNEINSQLDIIEAGQGKVVGVVVESSTDKEPIKMGNEQLATNRANSVLAFLSSIGVDAQTKTNILPDQGPDVYSKNMSSEERNSVREQTAQYRYVKVKFIVVYTVESTEEINTLPKVRNWIEVQMVNTNAYKKGGTVKLKGGDHFKTTTKKFKCKKVKVKGKPMKCSFESRGKTKTNMGWTNL